MGCGSANRTKTDETTQSKNTNQNHNNNDSLNQQLFNFTEETSARFLTDPDDLDMIMNDVTHKVKNDTYENKIIPVDDPTLVRMIKKQLPIQSVILLRQIQNKNPNLTHKALYDYIQSQNLLLNDQTVSSMLKMTRQQIEKNESSIYLDKLESFASIKILTLMNLNQYTKNILMQESYDKLQYQIMSLQNKLYSNQTSLIQLSEKHKNSVSQFNKIYDNYIKLKEKYFNCKQCILFKENKELDENVIQAVIAEFLYLDKRQRYKISLNDCRRRHYYYSIFPQFTSQNSEYLSINEFYQMYKFQEQHKFDNIIQNGDESNMFSQSGKYSVQQAIHEMMEINPQLTTTQIETQFREMDTENMGYITTSQFSILKSQLVETSPARLPVKHGKRKSTKDKVDFNHVLSILLERNPETDIEIADQVFKNSQLVKEGQIEKKYVEQIIQEITDCEAQQQEKENSNNQDEQQPEGKSEEFITKQPDIQIQITEQDIDNDEFPEIQQNYTAINAIVEQQRLSGSISSPPQRTLLEDVLADIDSNITLERHQELVAPDNALRASVDDLQFSQTQPEPSDRESRRPLGSQLRKVEELSSGVGENYEPKEEEQDCVE